MYDRFLEALRKLLINIILPFRKRREAFLSNFRLSIAFRISMSYLRMLLTHGILFMAIFMAIYMYSEKEEMEEMADHIIISMKEAKNSECVNPYYMQGISMKINRGDSNAEIYNDIFYNPDPDKAFFHSIHFDRKNKNNTLIISEDKAFEINEVEYQAHFQYDMTHSYRQFLSILWKIIIVYLGMVALIIRKGKRSDVKLFEPLRIMSATANRLTVHNLHSERLNEEGTKNELKDLANVINDMLDRIETSYESQKQFVSDASHELRTPIAVIQGYINMLNRWGATNKEVLEESIEAIQNEARSMQELVEKLLFLSRHDKKTLKLIKKRFNMRPVIEDMVKETKLVAPKHIISSPGLEDVIVYGDKQSLKQAIRVLVDNAVKYSNDGDEITILCQKVNEDCVITVSDTGIGMTNEDVDHIFDRFYRSDEVRNKNISGHGLGLSLAKLIIMAHTGRIKIRTQFNEGTSFIITIPKRRT